MALSMLIDANAIMNTEYAAQVLFTVYTAIAMDQRTKWPPSLTARVPNIWAILLLLQYFKSSG